ncbi:hypothetical protein [Cellulosimicrobium arenosum]|uniref:DUF4829 domain-containing protein n=1 Tax=Cellulosimicrobium arenosum TaxID=2708133 RepID=A0A927G6X8_9MICO|nr:hypothetical protein [Cellulosimicrobium arenosum]MBD8077825.1 hypothetical protein [Cellulosimicrobium arenosum]
MPTARRTAVVTLVAAATLAAATTVVVVTAPPPVTPVAMPPDDAPPEQVVDAYTRALAGHDCATAGALRTPGDEPTWCADLAALTDVHVGEPTVEDPRYSGHSPDQEVTYVPVTFDLDTRPFHGDGSMPEGATTWGYLLVRDADGDPWRIVDEGVG